MAKKSKKPKTKVNVSFEVNGKTVKKIPRKKPAKKKGKK